MRKGQSEVGRLSTVDKALDVLEFLRDKGEPERLSDISKSLGLQKSNVHRILTTFVKRGYVSQHPETLRYTLGISSWILGRSIEGLDAMIAYIQPYLEDLGDKVGETVYLAAIRQNIIVYLYTYTPPSVPGWVLQSTTFMPMHSTSAGKALLAVRPKEFVTNYLSDGLDRYTEYTITDPEIFLQELELTRQRDYALEVEETQIGLCAIDTALNIFQDEYFSLGFFLPVSKARGDHSDAAAKLLQCKADIQARLDRIRNGQTQT